MVRIDAFTAFLGLPSVNWPPNLAAEARPFSLDPLDQPLWPLYLTKQLLLPALPQLPAAAVKACIAIGSFALSALFLSQRFG